MPLQKNVYVFSTEISLRFFFFFVFADLTARLSWINWENLGVNPNRRGVLTSYSIPDNVNNWKRRYLNLYYCPLAIMIIPCVIFLFWSFIDCYDSWCFVVCINVNLTRTRAIDIIFVNKFRFSPNPGQSDTKLYIISPGFWNFRIFLK